MIKVNHLILVVLVVIGALMAYKIFSEDSLSSNLNKAYAQGGAVGNSEIIAIPVLDSNVEKLWVLRKTSVRREGTMTPPEWRLVIYSFDSRRLKIDAARLIDNDHIIPEYNLDPRQSGKSDLSPSSLRERAKRDEDKEK